MCVWGGGLGVMVVTVVMVTVVLLVWVGVDRLERDS